MIKPIIIKRQDQLYHFTLTNILVIWIVEKGKRYHVDFVRA